MMMFKKITVTVPQGIGDIFWVYQKVKPFCEKIAFRIAVVASKSGINDIQKRAESIVNFFPGVDEVSVLEMDVKDYHKVIHEKYSLGKLLTDRKHQESIAITYNVNSYLDEGTPLEKVDCLPVLRNVDLPVDAGLKLPEKYQLLYVSAVLDHHPKRSYLWSIRDWADIVQCMVLKSALPLYLLGAEFDRPTMEALKLELDRRKIPVGMIISPPAPQLFFVLSHAKTFVGYQSGLNILADNFNVPQLIIYFPHLDKMQDSWVKPDNRGGIFQHCRFDQGIGVAKELIKKILR